MEPVHLFELLCLEGMQAGLSWLTVLKKRQRFRQVFDNFDPVKLSHFGAAEIETLLTDPGIIRHRGKIEAVIGNARCFVALAEEQSPVDYLWSFVDRAANENCWETITQVPSQTRESKKMSDALKSKGFRFVGPTICYAFMQSAGMVNDHLVGCFRYSECDAIRRFQSQP
jgi:DNA-3-methyladenine glycosylase I